MLKKTIGGSIEHEWKDETVVPHSPRSFETVRIHTCCPVWLSSDLSDAEQFSSSGRRVAAVNERVAAPRARGRARASRT